MKKILEITTLLLLLAQLGQSFGMSNPAEKWFTIANKLIQNGENLDIWPESDAKNTTPLLQLIAVGHLFNFDQSYSLIEELLKHGANPNKITSSQYSNTYPLERAYFLGDNFIYGKETKKLLKLFFKYKADPNLKIGKENRTTLQNIICKASEYKLGGCPRALMLPFILNGADPFCKNSLGKSAIDYAKESKNITLENLLSQAPLKLIKFYELYLGKVLKLSNDVVGIIIKMLLPYYPIKETQK